MPLTSTGGVCRWTSFTPAPAVTLPWPGPASLGYIPVGYQNHPSWPGSFTGGVVTTTGTATTGQTYNFVDFQNGAGINVGSTGTHADNVTFNGCRFQASANVSNQGQNSEGQVFIFGANTTFNYCTFQPTTANYPAELTGEELSSDVNSYVQYGLGYQYAIVGGDGFNTVCTGLTIDHCDFWGFGNALQLAGSTVANPHIVRYSWFHHGADPFIVNVTANQFHNDCWLVNNGGYFGAQFKNCNAQIWGNTNVLAWQGTGSYDDAVVTGNLVGGDQETTVLSASGTSVRVTFRNNTFSTRIGRAVGSGDLIRSWAVSDSGTGSFWRGNKWLVAASESHSNYPGAHWGNPAWNGQYWWPSDTDSGSGHATDYTG